MRNVVKSFTLTATFLLSLGVQAQGKDLNVTVCDADKKQTQLIIRGTEAQYRTPSKAMKMTVIDRLEIEDLDLTRESKITGERLTGGEAVVLENSTSDVGVTVMHGESGAIYLGVIEQNVDVIGSTAHCK